MMNNTDPPKDRGVNPRGREGQSVPVFNKTTAMLFIVKFGKSCVRDGTKKIAT